MPDAEIIRLDLVRAQRALAKFRARADRAVVDTLYGPALQGLSAAEIDALMVHGLAEIGKRRGSGLARVTLTPTGRRERDRNTKKKAK